MIIIMSINKRHNYNIAIKRNWQGCFQEKKPNGNYMKLQFINEYDSNTSFKLCIF